MILGGAILVCFGYTLFSMWRWRWLYTTGCVCLNLRRRRKRSNGENLLGVKYRLERRLVVIMGQNSRVGIVLRFSFVFHSGYPLLHRYRLQASDINISLQTSEVVTTFIACITWLLYLQSKTAIHLASTLCLGSPCSLPRSVTPPCGAPHGLPSLIA